MSPHNLTPAEQELLREFNRGRWLRIAALVAIMSATAWLVSYIG